MAEVSDEGMVGLEVNGGGVAMTTPLNVSGSFKEGPKSSSRRRTSVRPSFDADNEFMNLLHGSDLVKVELNRLENEVRDKDRELGDAQAEIKALRLSERREKVQMINRGCFRACIFNDNFCIQNMESPFSCVPK